MFWWSILYKLHVYIPINQLQLKFSHPPSCHFLLFTIRIHGLELYSITRNWALCWCLFILSHDFMLVEGLWFFFFRFCRSVFTFGMSNSSHPWLYRYGIPDGNSSCGIPLLSFCVRAWNPTDLPLDHTLFYLSM